MVVDLQAAAVLAEHCRSIVTHIDGGGCRSIAHCPMVKHSIVTACHANTMKSGADGHIKSGAGQADMQQDMQQNKGRGCCFMKCEKKENASCTLTQQLRQIITAELTVCRGGKSQDEDKTLDKTARIIRGNVTLDL